MRTDAQLKRLAKYFRFMEAVQCGGKVYGMLTLSNQWCYLTRKEVQLSGAELD